MLLEVVPMIRLKTSYLEGNNLYNSNELIKNICCGVPQGSSLAPISFILHVNGGSRKLGTWTFRHVQTPFLSIRSEGVHCLGSRELRLSVNE